MSRIPCPLAALLCMSPALALAEPAPAEPPGPPPVARFGEGLLPRPRLASRPWATRLSAPLSMTLGGEAVGGLPTDALGTEYAPEPTLDAEIRAGVSFATADALSLLSFEAHYEHDLHIGHMAGGTRGFEAVSPPFAPGTSNALRKAYASLSVGPFVTLTGGYMTSHWGLGLVANDGAHGFEAGEAVFSRPRGGDRVLRAAVATGPWTGGKVVVQAAYDKVEDDDALILDDTATQMSAGVIVGFQRPERPGVGRGGPGPRSGGLYAARRHQETADGRATDVTVLDAFGRTAHSLGGLRLTGAFEAAYLTGETALAPTPEHVRHDLQQLGVAARAGLDAGCLGAVLDVIYASGDENLDDGEVNAFKADPNYELGLFLFRHVMAAQSARAPVNAADPELSGRPAPDLDRLPTRGAVTNTLAFFPRFFWRPAAGLELFSGPLLALAAAAPTDPRNTRLAGGEPHNAYNGTPGGYLGTELDAGLHYALLVDGMAVTAGLEGGILLPGSAFEDASGEGPGSVGGGRATLRLEF